VLQPFLVTHCGEDICTADEVINEPLVVADAGTAAAAAAAAAATAAATTAVIAAAAVRS
jgi:hypothetical protein